MKREPMTTTLTEYEILIPTSPSGEIATPTLSEDVQQLIIDSFGGFSIEGQCRGSWRDKNGRVHRDVNDIYVVASDSEESVLTVARAIGRLLLQTRMYVRLPGERVIMVDTDDTATL